jgi:hypothetical protein
MKLFLTCFLFFLLGFNVNAQTPKDDVRYQRDELSKKDAEKDCVLMKNDKMFIIVKGQMTAMTADYTLTNGDVVSKEGKVTAKDGSSKQMKNGDCVSMAGVWSHYDQNSKTKTVEEKKDADQ